MAYTYTLLTTTTFEVVGTNYKSTFNGDETAAIAMVQQLTDAELSPIRTAKLKSS